MKYPGLRAFALLIALLLGTAPARADWRRAVSPNFIVYSTGSESALRERILALEDFDHLMRIITSVNEPPAPTRLNVYLVSGHAELVTVRPVGPSIAGFYSASPSGIAAFVDERAGMEENELLFHEYAHHFMLQYRPNAYPAWYVEGFAEYFMTVRFRPGTIDIGNYSRARVGAIEGNWLPMDVILSVQPQTLDPERMHLFYAQSWLLVHYFFSNPERQAALRRYLVAARASGADPRSALQSALGMTPEQLTQELRSYIGGGQIRYRQMRRSSADAPPAVTMTVLPRGANELMLYDGALRIGIDDARRAGVLTRIRALAAHFPDDPFAMRVLAEAEALYGDGAVADRLLDTLLAVAPNDAELLYFKGMRHLAAAEANDAATESETRIAHGWFDRARRADPNHFQSLYRYAVSARGGADYRPEENAELMLAAHRLAPQVSDISMNAAAMLMNRGRYLDAAIILQPLAADPHNASLAAAARQMLGAAAAMLHSGAPVQAGNPPAKQ